MSEQNNGELSLLQWINVVLSFLFMLIILPVAFWLVTELVASSWRTLMFESPLSWGFLAIILILAFSNAFYYYKRVKSKLTK